VSRVKVAPISVLSRYKQLPYVFFDGKSAQNNSLLAARSRYKPLAARNFAAL